MKLEDVEIARKAYLKRLIKQGVLFLIILIVAIIISAFASETPIELIARILLSSFIILTFAVIITMSFNSKLSDAYENAYKSYFVEHNLRQVFTDLTYSSEAGISSTLLAHTGMIKTGDRYFSNDFATGKYKNVTFSQADVHIEEEHRDSDGDSTYTTIFKGRFMIFDFPKQFNFKLELVGKKFRAYRVPGENATTGRKMQKISTESNEFNRNFRIFGEDGFEAYYILDPAFMVKIQDIALKHKKKVIFCFIENHLFIGLDDGKDAFESPRPYKPIDEAKENAKIVAEIRTITEFVDQLSLDRKLFSDTTAPQATSTPATTSPS